MATNVSVHPLSEWAGPRDPRSTLRELWSTIYTGSVTACYISRVTSSSTRVNIVLDGERATKLERMAERTHINAGTLARSLLSTAIDEADPDAREVTALLDSIDGAWERAARGSDEARAGLGVPLEDF